MHIADSVRGRRTLQKRRPAGVDDQADRAPVRVRSREWHTGPAKAVGSASTFVEMSFTRDRLGELRRFVAQEAAEVSLDPARIADLVLAVDELATNSVCHGGGAGTLRMWREGDVLLCDICDLGQIRQESVCLSPPDPTQISGRGLWIVSQLCDLVQIRSSLGHSTVRVHMHLA